MKKLLFLDNSADFFLSHRSAVAVAAREAGYEVHVATPDSKSVQRIQELGFQYHLINMDRSGQNPLREILTLVDLFLLFRRTSPDIVHLVTIKPVLYGGLIARFLQVRCVVAAVSGLGTVFTANSFLARLRKGFISFLYRHAFRQNRLFVIFQNPDDRQLLLDSGALVFEQSRLIRGSGVDLESYRYLPESDGVPVVVMAARLLRDKGVYEFLDAARILRSRNVKVRFKLIGAPDLENPSSVKPEHIERWKEEGIVELLGFSDQVAQHYADGHIVCLPSYREGLPRGLIEAAACGRPVVTTDVPGCRDAIIPGQTGLLVPVMNAAALADAIQSLVESPALRQKMGVAGRAFAESEFSIQNVISQHLDIYHESEIVQ